MTDLTNDNEPGLAIDLGVLAFPNNTLNGVTSGNFFEFGTTGAPFNPSFTTDIRDYYMFTPYRMDTITISFDADSVGEFVSALGVIPISGVSRVVGDVFGTWYGGEHNEHRKLDDEEEDREPGEAGFRPSFTREFYDDIVRSEINFVRSGGINGQTGENTDWSEATWAVNEFPDAQATWYLTGAPVIFRIFGAESDGSDNTIFSARNPIQETSYDFDIFPSVGQADPKIDFDELYTGNPDISNALAAAYEVLLGGVPNENGFMDLINMSISTNFGSGRGPVFNQENIFINLVNNLVQGNGAARSKFDSIATGSTNAEKIAAIYREIVPSDFQTNDGLDFITRPDAITFYQSAAAERGITGPDAAAIIAMASLLNIAVNSNFGVGNGVNDLYRAVGNGSYDLPKSQNQFTDLERADGDQFDGDDASLTLVAGYGYPDEVPGLTGLGSAAADDMVF